MGQPTAGRARGCQCSHAAALRRRERAVVNRGASGLASALTATAATTAAGTATAAGAAGRGAA